MQELIKGMIITVAEKVFGTLKVGKSDAAIDLSGEWREVEYKQVIVDRMGDDWYDLALEEAVKKAEAEGLSNDPAWDIS